MDLQIELYFELQRDGSQHMWLIWEFGFFEAYQVFLNTHILLKRTMGFGTKYGANLMEVFSYASL